LNEANPSDRSRLERQVIWGEFMSFQIKAISRLNCLAATIGILAIPFFSETGRAQSAPKPAAASAPAATVQLETINVIATTPVPGAIGIDANKVPAAVSTVNAQDFDVLKSPSVTDAITQHVPGAISINVDGSGLSPDLFYRGFDVSRISGIPNGLAVYQNGVRINEGFGDGVNLDLIPPIAIDRTDVYTNNPVFGLNALGGAIAFTMKNGFTFHGGDATFLAGSFGRVNGFMEYGKEFGPYSVYIAADGYRDGGYRHFGAQDAERAYIDLGYRTQDAEIHTIGSFGRSLLGVQGVTPVPLVNQQYNSVFTTPQTTNNEAELAQLTARVNIAPKWTLNSNFYFRHFDQWHVDGNDADVDGCDIPGDPNSPVLCIPADNAPPGVTTQQRVFLANGHTIPFLGDDFPYGSTARTATHTNTVGTQQQVTNRDQIFDHDNYFVFGASVDASFSTFGSATSLGQLNSQFQNLEFGFPGAGSVLAPAGGAAVGFGPVSVRSNATYYGVFALDTFNITKQLALTAGARLNLANIGLNDLSGTNPQLNSSNEYNRINPVVGLTYEFNKELTIYAGYSEANRAPTPLESTCSNKFNPCILETALVSDPPLQQVVTHTVEAGARGAYTLPSDYGTLVYKAGYFRTQATNDIVSEASELTGQGFFVNVPETLRQGVEAGLTYNIGAWNFYGNYAFIDATYQFSAAFSSPNNPFANSEGEIMVHPGDHIPGIPRHMGKFGFEYAFTPKFKVGMDTLFVGAQYFFADDSNQNPQLPFYYTLNLHASYQVTDNIQVFGIVNNLTNNHYATFGTFFQTDTTAANVNATLAANRDSTNPNAQAVTVAQPISFYGGVKITF
jgi:iron complex outermembrane recepter protein